MITKSYSFNFFRTHHECCEDSPTPDDHFFRHISQVYAQNHPVMKTGTDCNETFPGGITNGAHWYELNGKFISKIKLFNKIIIFKI